MCLCCPGEIYCPIFGESGQSFFSYIWKAVNLLLLEIITYIISNRGNLQTFSFASGYLIDGRLCFSCPVIQIRESLSQEMN